MIIRNIICNLVNFTETTEILKQYWKIKFNGYKLLITYIYDKDENSKFFEEVKIYKGNKDVTYDILDSTDIKYIEWYLEEYYDGEDDWYEEVEYNIPIHEIFTEDNFRKVFKYLKEHPCNGMFKK